MSWLSIIGLGLLFGYLLVFIYKTKTGSPYLASQEEEIKTLMQYIPQKAKVCDFGAGDGRVMLAIANHRQAEVWGWEIEPLIWLKYWLKLRKTKAYQNGKVHYLWGDMWKPNLNRFQILVVYQLERFAPRLVKKCQREMRSGSLVITNTYPIKGLKEIKRDGKIIIYQI